MAAAVCAAGAPVGRMGRQTADFIKWEACVTGASAAVRFDGGCLEEPLDHKPV